MSPIGHPVVHVIAGPNGAGKTTFAREFLPAANVTEVLNADLLAAGLSPLQPGAMAVRSARLLLTRWRELVAQRREFAFEPEIRNKKGRDVVRCWRENGLKKSRHIRMDLVRFFQAICPQQITADRPFLFRISG